MEADIFVVDRMPRMKSEMEIIVPGQPTVRYVSEEVPEVHMDELKTVIGDGKARVSVTSDVGVKDFGTGASASVTVVLTCGQDAQSIERAYQLASELSRGYAHENRQRAENELQQILAQRQQIPR